MVRWTTTRTGVNTYLQREAGMAHLPLPAININPNVILQL
jgi:hypothetical protein